MKNKSATLNFLRKKENNNSFVFNFFDLTILFLYIFLSTFEIYLVPLIGNITKYIMFLLIMIFCLKGLRQGKFVINGVFISVLLWFGFKCISIFSGKFNDIIPLHFASQIGFVGFFLIISLYRYQKQQVKKIFLCFWVVSLIFNILSLFFSEPYQVIYTSRNVLTLFGVQNDPNNCAAFSLFGIIISCYSIFYLKRYYVFSIINLILGSFVVLLTGSRGGLIAIGVVILFWFLFMKPFNILNLIFRVSVIFLLFVIFLMVAPYVLPPNTINRLFNFFGDGGSGRLQLWIDAFNLFKTKPLLGGGWGAATYFNKRFPQAVHNTYLSMLAEGGIVSFSLFIYPYFILIFKGIKKGNKFPLLMLSSMFILCFFIDAINKRFIWNALIISYFSLYLTSEDINVKKQSKIVQDTEFFLLKI